MVEQRSARRYALPPPLAAGLLVFTPYESHEGTIQNISSRGVNFSTDRPLAAGTPLELKITLPLRITAGIEDFIRARGRVLRAERRQEAGAERVGVAAAIEKYDIFEDTILKQAKAYVDDPSIHTPWLTAFFLVALLDSHIILIDEAMVKKLAEMGNAFRLTNLLPPPWDRIIRLLISLLFLPVSLIGIYLLLTAHVAWLALLWALYLCWHYFRRLRANFLLGKARRKFTRWKAALRKIRTQVEKGLYDAEESTRRLHRLEESGLPVASLVYRLLALGASPLTPLQ